MRTILLVGIQAIICACLKWSRISQLLLRTFKIGGGGQFLLSRLLMILHPSLEEPTLEFQVGNQSRFSKLAASCEASSVQFKSKPNLSSAKANAFEPRGDHLSDQKGPSGQLSASQRTNWSANKIWRVVVVVSLAP